MPPNGTLPDDWALDFNYAAVGRPTGVDDSDALATDFELVYDAWGSSQLERHVTGLLGTRVVFDRDYDEVGLQFVYEGLPSSSMVVFDRDYEQVIYRLDAWESDRWETPNLPRRLACGDEASRKSWTCVHQHVSPLGWCPSVYMYCCLPL